MNALSTIFQADWAERVGWTLLHSLWQVTLLAIAYHLVSILLRNRPATVRYFVCCVTLFSMLGFPLSTYYLLSQNPIQVSTDKNDTPTLAKGSNDLPVSSNLFTHSEDLITDPISPATQSSSTERETDTVSHAVLPTYFFTDELLSLLRPWLPLATIVWLMGTALFALRPLWGWLHVRRLKRHGLSPLANQLRDLGTSLAIRLGVKQSVQFFQSSLVEVPTVVGCLSPIILLPASVVTGLTVQEIELILAHELAHVRRHDYLINLAQTVIESLLFYHPGMWWISNQIRQERENCCDDIAVTLGKTVPYTSRRWHGLNSNVKRRQPWY
ncbi:M56 family metallopeptidase [uncultured Gimesia sp.]|uniref:M56 family metallopeptidase n=1 Tax=uncultured Gimesia sp. TaxID=1678688 RepID=UPI0030DB7247|tara:strand:+ start:39207 stop:40187 length:981 start_codon:yes stop_codon:yes gene_type:complete